MDKEYYESKEYKRFDEYKPFKAELYHAQKEYYAPKKEEIKTYEENDEAPKKKIKEPKNEGPSSSSLKDMISKVGQTSTSLVTSTAIVAGAGAAVIAPEIFNKPPEIIYPIVEMATIDIGNDFFTYDIMIDDNDNNYKLYITNKETSEEVKTITLKNGNNKDFIKDLAPSTPYEFKVYSETIDKTLYSEDYVTKDGTVPMFVYNINEYLYNEFSTSIEYNIYISDPLNLYNEYNLNITNNNPNSNSYGELFESNYNEGKYIKNRMDYCPMGPLKFEIYGMDNSDVPPLIDSYDYIAKSQVKELTSFPIAYTIPSIDEVSYRFVNHSLMVDIPISFKTDLADIFNIKVVVKDNEGNLYEGYSSGELTSVDLPDSVTSFSVDYLEVAHIDGEEKVFKKGKIDGVKQVVEEVKPNHITVNQTRNRLNINLTPNIKSDSNIRLTNKSDGSVRNMHDFYEFTPLPTSLTTFTYQIVNANNELIGDEYSFVIDPSLYNVRDAETFVPTGPRNIVKTFNDDGTWNMYLYTGFNSTNPNLSWTLKLTETNSYDKNYTYFTSKDKVLEVTNLDSQYSFEYSIGEEHNGVYYEATPLDPVNYDTRTDYTEYYRMVQFEFINNKTIINFAFDDTDRVYDFDNSKLYLGNYTPISLNNSDFTYDSVNHKYMYQTSVDREITWIEYRFKTNPNLKNIEKIKNIMPLKGNLCGPFELYKDINNQGGNVL